MKSSILIIVCILSFASCIKESLSDCTYQYQVKLFVEEKRYAGEYPDGVEPINENLPFKAYVGDIYYTLQNVKTGTLITSRVFDVIDTDEKELTLSLDDISNGTYKLTVWGNVEDVDYLAALPYTLHANEEESTDIYLACRTFDFNDGEMQDLSMGLRRLKGKLYLELADLPPHVDMVTKTITNLHAVVSDDVAYSGETKVGKSFPLSGQQATVAIETTLAPTVAGKQSLLSLSFRNKETGVHLQVDPPLEVAIKKNEITYVKASYNSSEDKLEIWLFIDGKWQFISKLDIK